jgi:hypothetical protein
MPRALTTASSLVCPHGGTVIGIPTAPKVTLAGAPVLTAGDSFQIIGCPFVLPGGKPSPCLVIEWVLTDLKTQAGDQATLSEASVGLCMADTGAPQGTVIVAATQPKGQTI